MVAPLRETAVPGHVCHEGEGAGGTEEAVLNRVGWVLGVETEIGTSMVPRRLLGGVVIAVESCVSVEGKKHRLGRYLPSVLPAVQKNTKRRTARLSCAAELKKKQAFCTLGCLIHGKTMQYAQFNDTRNRKPPLRGGVKCTRF